MTRINGQECYRGIDEDCYPTLAIQGFINFNSLMMEISPYRNQLFDLIFKSMDWFLYDRDFCHKRVKLCSACVQCEN